MKSVIITGLFTIAAAVISSIVSWQLGKADGINEVTNYMSDQLAPIYGNNNIVTINDIGAFISDYEDTKDENEEIKKLNADYESQLAKDSVKIDSLTTQMGDSPVLNFRDLSLSIEGETVAVNSSDAMAVINGKEYISKEIAEKLLDDGQNVSYKDDTMYIGRVIADRANLFEQWNVDLTSAWTERSGYDSYGNFHQNVLEFYQGECSATYNLNRKYANLKLSMAIKTDGREGYVGVVTIKADGTVVYTSPELGKTTEPITVSDIALNNCSLLEIDYNSNGGSNNRCLIFDAIVYN